MNQEVVVCMLKQGLVKNGLEYAKLKAPFTRDGFVELIKDCPSQALLKALVDGRKPSERSLPIGVMMKTLVEEDKFELTLPFIQELQNSPSLGKLYTVLLLKVSQTHWA